jgi:hypothetical protein
MCIKGPLHVRHLYIPVLGEAYKNPKKIVLKLTLWMKKLQLWASGDQRVPPRPPDDR